MTNDESPHLAIASKVPKFRSREVAYEHIGHSIQFNIICIMRRFVQRYAPMSSMALRANAQGPFELCEISGANISRLPGGLQGLC